MSSTSMRFPSGRPVDAVKKDAKKLSKTENIKLAEAQRILAAENGLDLPWNEALRALRNAQSLPDVQKNRNPDNTDTKLPHSSEAERAVLCGLMIDWQSLPIVSEAISADDFYHDSHRYIYEAMVGLSAKEQPLDTASVSEELERRGGLEGAGGLSYLRRLASDVPSATNVGAYACIVRERSTLRSLIAASAHIAAAPVIS